MAYDGYWRLGDTEIINSGRTAAYVGTLMPSFGLSDCTDCEGVAQALGDVKTYGPEERVQPGYVRRTNLIKDPRARASWSGSISSSVTLTYEPVGGPANAGTWVKSTLTQAGTGAFRTIVQTAGVGNFAPVLPGEQYVVTLEEIHSHTPGSRIGPYITWYDSTATQISQGVPGIAPGPNGQWNRVEVTFTAPVGAAYARIGLSGGPDTGWPVGAYIGLSEVMMLAKHEADAWGLDYFDGSTGVDTLEHDTVWTGQENFSTSQDREFQTRVPIISDNSYRTPAVDGAPWVDSSNPALNDFWGVYPLGVTGADDSTRTLPVTELITDGAVTGLPRAASREMRFDVLLMGRDENAVNEGFHWLNRALDASRCDDARLGCSGSPLSFFSACPPACDYTGCPDSPADWDWGTPLRINWWWLTNPDPSTAGYSAIGDADFVGTFFRADAVKASDVADGPIGIAYRLDEAFAGYGGYAATQPSGTPLSLNIGSIIGDPGGEAAGTEGTVELRLRNNGAETGDVFSTPFTLDTLGFAANVQVNGVATLPFDGYEARVVIDEWAGMTSGDSIGLSAPILELVTQYEGPYFSGWTYDDFTLNSQGLTSYWMNEAGTGPSALVEEPDDLDAWRVVQTGTPNTDPRAQWGAIFDASCTGAYNYGIEMSGPSALPTQLTRTLSGLIPGQWYIVEAVIGLYGPEQVKMQVRGQAGEVIYTRYSPVCGDDEPTQALWFLATSPVMFLDFTTEGMLGNPNETSYLVRHLNVTRASRDNNIYQTTFPDDGTPFNGWKRSTLPVAFTSTVTRDGGSFSSVENLTFLNVAGNATISADTPLMQRSIRGLTPGESYRVTFAASMGFSYSESDPITMGMWIAGSEDTAVLDDQFGGGPMNFSLTFVATADAHDLFIGVIDPFALSGSMHIELYSASVQRIETGPVPYPDASLEYQRTLYRVAALTGPTITERFDLDAGAMIRVTFGLVAGVPDQYGPLVSAGSALGGSSAPLRQIDCSNGEVVLTNLVTNPKPAASLAGGWGVGNALTRAAGVVESTPTIDIDVTGTGTASAQYLYIGELATTPVPAETEWVAVGIDVRPRTATVAANMRLVLRLQQGSTTVVQENLQDGGWQNGVWRRSILSAQRPAGSTVDNIDALLWPASVTLPAGPGWHARRAVIATAPTKEAAEEAVATYFDGDSVDGSWTGTPDLSTSVYEFSGVADLIDPDCPPLPAPPAPPTIEEDCIEDPTSWTRYTIYIPADQVPRFSASIPVVTLRTGNATARQVRMRWYPNPDGLNITELQQCAYEGEVIVSYVPPEAEMVVDAIAREATASVRGGVQQPATQLLYGPDGGPMEWPSLSCNLPYVFTVDVDSAKTVDELDVLLSLGLKV